MPITWPNVPTVAVDERVTSAQRNALAEAFNARLRSGLGDGTFRLWWKIYALMRELRAPEGFLYPAADEWLSDYLHADPATGGPEGNLNFFAPLPMWAFGEQSTGIDAEDVVLNDIATDGSTDPVAQWNIGKGQRGALAANGAYASPVLTAAYRARNFGGWGPSLQKFFSIWGGFLGANYELCQGGVTQKYSFKPLRAGFTDLEYSSCDYQYLQVVHYPDRYLVFLEQSGPALELLYTDYLLIVAPTGGAAFPFHTSGTQMREALTWFISSFRGSEAQRAEDGFRIAETGFDFEKFFTRQYLLAPAKGNISGDQIFSEYPEFAFNAISAALPRLTAAIYAGVTSYDFAGFCFAGYKVSASGITGSVTVNFIDQSTGLPIAGGASVGIANGQRVHWFEHPASVTLQIVSETVIPAGAFIEFELAPLECYKPNLLDAYVVLRRGSCKSGGVDTIGQNYSQAKTLGENYFACGAIVNADGAAEPSNISENPIYETVRRVIRSNHRLVKRDNFASYTEVGGKAILTFKRTTGSGLEIFDGLLPPVTPIPTGQIQSGVEYRVHGNTGGVTYHGATHAPGGTFTGVTGVTGKSYTTTGDATPHQINGIITSAPEQGHTNEWTMFMTFNTFDAAGLSPEDYGDPLGFLLNRCQLLSSTINLNASGGAGNLAIMGDSGFNSSATLTPKIPSAYNYAYGANQTLSPAFFKSCPIYPADYEVERAEIDEATGFAKITLAGPLRTANGTERSWSAARSWMQRCTSWSIRPIPLGNACGKWTRIIPTFACATCTTRANSSRITRICDFCRKSTSAPATEPSRCSVRRSWTPSPVN